MTAVVCSVSMAMAVVVAVYVRVIAQFPRQQGFHRPVSLPGDTAVELNACLGQGILGPAADAASDHAIHLFKAV